MSLIAGFVQQNGFNIGVRFRLTVVSAECMEGGKFWDLSWCLLNRGCPLNMGSLIQVLLYEELSPKFKLNKNLFPS